MLKLKNVLTSICLCVCIVLSGCAKKEVILGREAWEKSFEHNMVLDWGCFDLGEKYVLDLYIYNYDEQYVNVWLTQVSTSVDKKVRLDTRVYKGQEQSIHIQYELSEISDIIRIVIKNENGMMILRSIFNIKDKKQLTI